ncbi:MAG: hypothetical protein WAR79_02345 [Melioribacteraceae bacterium]
MKRLRIIIILFLVNILGCSETSPTEEKLGNGRISLKGNIENITIGMDSLSVINKLGEPDYYGIADIIIENIILGYQIDENGSLEISLFNDYLVDSIFTVFQVKVRLEYLGTTENGIGIGSSKQEVIKFLGNEITYNVPKEYCEFNTRFIFSYNEQDIVDQIAMAYYRE